MFLHVLKNIATYGNIVLSIPLEVKTVENYYTPQEVAEKLKLNIRTVYKWIKEGRIKAVKIGDLWRIPESEINRILNID